MPIAQLLAFWQLGSGGMLLWGLAALLPILLHLWSRRRYQTTQWAAMKFLLAAMQQNRRRIQFEQWVLLALRTAMLVLFALALADPIASLIPSWTSVGAGARTHTVIVIDGSFSMDYRNDAISRFDEAKQYARKLVEQASQGDGFTLMLMADPPRVVIGQAAFDKEDVLQEIDALQPVDAGANLPATLADIATILQQADQRPPHGVRHVVCMLTDLQQATWQDVATAETRRRLATIAETASLQLIDFGEADEANSAITRFEALDPVLTTAGETRFQVDVRNFASQPLAQRRVTLRVDGQLVAERRADVPARETVSVPFAYRFESPGEFSLEARIEEDRLPVDNQRWLAAVVHDSIHVLCIFGRPGATQFAALALEPNEGEQPRVRVEQAPESALAESDLPTFDCVLLANIEQFSRDEAMVLERYVRGGGGLIITLGDQVQASSYNQHLGKAAGASRLLPAELMEQFTGLQLRVNPLGYRHSIAAPFKGHEKSGLLTTPIWTYIKLVPDPQAKVALALDNGDPLLIEQQVGRGRVVLFASAVSPDSLNAGVDPPTPWTAISSWPSFPPLMQEMLKAAIGGREQARNAIVGDELSGDVANASADTLVEMHGPGELRERLPLSLDAWGARWHYTGANDSGLYELQIGLPVQKTQRFALNVDPAESNLERFPREELPTQLIGDVQATNTSPATTTAVPAASYFRELLLAVLGLALGELLLSWRLGRGLA